MSRFFRIGFMAAAAMGAAALTHAGDIYRWTDSRGAVHIGDVVPPAYRKKARLLHVQVQNGGFAVSPKAAARPAHAASTPASSAQKGSTGGSAMSDASTERQVTNREACERQMRAYQESEACFGRYKIEGGKTRADAFQHCQAVPMPQCD